ncbi:carboxypeptidase-like regulatory domain-containing protein [Ferruginibacter lapsinanis]|uniref:carboxypeptidase-like regulatory domain-containing protein n=1 Tax=Ferruginibacter lapsinanis TaxID=563172 RepID=UPI001E442D5C|nr:carboxypeptidase-like regulatory domain-containing protein [Ferruginibacter lapsinanis]UEG48623.1 carboxypeptidase-like regulatory domain-containing protein [Ferruginibacter lapsinanis]
MSNNKINSIYTVEDIYDYLSGKMTPAERHAIEKAALDDPLLADAIEGYSNVPEFTQEQGFENINEHLVNLRAKFITDKTAAVSIKNYKTIWRAAAAVLLLIGGTVLALYFSDHLNNKITPIAKVEPSVTSTITPIPLDSTKAITGGNSNTKVEKQEIAFTKKEEPVSFTAKKQAEEKIIQSDDERIEPITATNNMKSIADEKNIPAVAPRILKSDEAAVAAEKRKEELSAKKAVQNNSKNVVFSGRVVNKNNQPIAFASLKTEEGLMSTTDDSGMFSLPISKKKTGKVTFRASNYLQKTVIASGGFQTIVLDNNRVSNSNNSNIANTQNKPGQVLVLHKTGAEPKEGWQKYLSYLVEKISYSTYDTGKPVTGETIVIFDIDTKGEPMNFSFEKQIDADVNDAVEDLIVTGPEWKLTDEHLTIGHIKLKIIF